MTFPALAAFGLAALLGGGLVPSPEDERLLREQAVGEEISRTLALVPGVTAARVHVRLAERGLLSRGEAKPFALAVVRVDDRKPDAEILREIVQAAVPGAEAEAVRVVVVQEKAEAPPSFVNVGPFVVAAASANGLRTLLIAVFFATAALSVGLIRAGLRLRRRRGPTSIQG